MFRQAIGFARRGIARRRKNVLPRSRPVLESLETRTLLSLSPESALGLNLGVNPQASMPPIAVAIDDAGSTYLAGTFQGEVDFNPGGSAEKRTSQGGSPDIFVARYSTAGALDWVVTLGDTGYDAATGVAVQGDRVFVTGEFTGSISFSPNSPPLLSTGDALRFDGFVLSLDASSGDLVYAAQVEGGSARGTENLPTSIVADASGNAYVTGSIQGDATFGSLPTISTRVSPGGGREMEAFVAKLNADGSFDWAQSFTGTGDGFANGQGKGIAVDGDGNVVTTGWFGGSVDFDPSEGTATHTASSFHPDIFISKLDASGNYVWSRRVGNSDYDVGEGIGVDASNNVYVTGKFTSPKDANGNPIPVDFDPGSGQALISTRLPEVSDLFTMKLDEGGNFHWVRPLKIDGDASEPGRGGIAVLPNGTVFVTGSFKNAGRGNDVLLAQLDTNGVFFGLTTGGSTANDVTQSIAINANGRVAITGQTFGGATFGNVAIPASSDSFVAYYDSDDQRVYAVGDYDGDGVTDPVVFEPSTSTFYISRSSLGNVAVQFGQGTLFGGDPAPIPADYDGDGRTDPAVFEPSTATSYLARSSLGNIPIQFGQGTLYGGNPIPIPADYDGDGKVDVAVFEPSTATSYLARSQDGNIAIQFGQGTLYGGDPIPIPADYDGDGKADVAVFEPSTATSYLARSQDGNIAIQFGQGTLYGGNPIPIPADYDGDGKVDVAVFEPSTATSYLARSQDGNIAIQFGQGTLFGGNPIPIPADYDGDGKMDVAVFETSTATFYLARSEAGNIPIQFGQGTLYGGRPIPEPMPQALRFSRVGIFV